MDIEGEDKDWDFGTGAGFYVDATKAPYDKGYKMYTYITKELPPALYNQFSQLDSSKVSIMGHSMGGHGALTLFLKNPGMYKSVSAFAPISNPKACPWGQKAFAGYLAKPDEWNAYDATELVKGHKGRFEALIDVGDEDNFYKQKQLLPENLVEASKMKGQSGIELRIQPVCKRGKIRAQEVEKCVGRSSANVFRVMTTAISSFRRLRRIMLIIMLSI